MDKSLLIDFAPEGDIELPPSKSLGHRALICAALAASDGQEESRLSRAALSEDIEATAKAMELFGAQAVLKDRLMSVRPAVPVSTSIDCAESGSTLRFLLPLAAARLSGSVVFTGRGRLLKRPLQPYEELFARCGVRFERSEESLILEGRLKAGAYELPGHISSQFISGLLLALPLVEGRSRLRLSSELESAPYVDLTLEVMESFGVRVERPDEKNFLIDGGQRYQAANYELEADYSQAAFFLAAGALGRPVRCLGLKPKSRQGDRQILDILRQAGAVIDSGPGWLKASCPGRLKAFRVDVREIPDLVPVLASLAALAQGESRIENAARLRFKESDRLASMTEELTKLGAKIRQEPDALIIEGQSSLPGGALTEAHGDHRVAMALAVASLGCRQPISLIGADCVKKSYPHFWRDFGRHL